MPAALRNLSYRFKLPLAFTAVVLVTGVALGATSTLRAYEAARMHLVENAARMGELLGRALENPLRTDGLWEAYRIVESAGARRDGQSPAIVVLDREGRVFVASDPLRYPVGTDPAGRGLDHRRLALEGRTVELAASGDGKPRPTTRALEDVARDRLLIIVPVEDEGERLGSVILLYSRAALLPPVLDVAARTGLATTLVLAALAPLGWVWGRRLARPLVHLSDTLGRLVVEPPEAIEAPPARGEDEVGVLAERMGEMLQAMREKRAMERQAIASERLAAVGRLAAGVAHEINNPLGGMINALDTYRKHAQGADLTEHTLSLLERGLVQIRETVSALLVETRLENHPLAAADLEDVRTLAEPELARRQARVEWEMSLHEPIPVPSTQVRQVLLNLLLNAAQATPALGRVRCTVRVREGMLDLEVENEGDPIPPREREHLFEPFVGSRPDGSGLGLWVTYQVVQQLRGTIDVQCSHAGTCFTVRLPLAGTRELWEAEA